MAYYCNVQNSCRFSSCLTKFNNRALSKVDSRHSHRHKKGLIPVIKKKEEVERKEVMENFSQLEFRQ